jgi:autotransporter adhesin
MERNMTQPRIYGNRQFRYPGPRAAALLVGLSSFLLGVQAFAQFRAESDLGGGDNIQGATATNADDTAVGPNASATGSASTAVGSSSTASGLFSTALGDSSTASGAFATALGREAMATQIGTTALGQGARATGELSTAIGDAALASGERSTVVGENADATAFRSTAIGELSNASGSASTALGSVSRATGNLSTAVGAGANATALRSTALGASSRADFENSTAIGYDVETTRADQMMFGTASNTYTAPGITSAASRAAQSGPVEVVTSDAHGNLATASASQLGLATVAQMDRNTEGVAMAMALTRIPTVLPVDKRYAVSTTYGSFGGENAVGVGGALTLTQNVVLSGGGAVGIGGYGQGGGSAGITFAR